MHSKQSRYRNMLAQLLEIRPKLIFCISSRKCNGRRLRVLIVEAFNLLSGDDLRDTWLPLTLNSDPLPGVLVDQRTSC